MIILANLRNRSQFLEIDSAIQLSNVQQLMQIQMLHRVTSQILGRGDGKHVLVLVSICLTTGFRKFVRIIESPSTDGNASKKSNLPFKPCSQARNFFILELHVETGRFIC